MLQRAQVTPFTKARAWLEIDQLAVDPRFRRRGIGRGLVHKTVSEAHELFRGLGFAPKTMRFERTEKP